MVRPYSQVEKRLVAEYVHQQWPDEPQWYRVRLGDWRAPAHEPRGAKTDRVWAKVTQRWCDAIVFNDPRVWLIEGKIYGTVEASAQLQMYKELFWKTSEFKHYRNAPITMLLVAAFMADDVKRFVERQGIETDVYAPQWAVQYMASRKGR